MTPTLRRLGTRHAPRAPDGDGPPVAVVEPHPIAQRRLLLATEVQDPDVLTLYYRCPFVDLRMAAVLGI